MLDPLELSARLVAAAVAVPHDQVSQRARPSRQVYGPGPLQGFLPSRATLLSAKDRSRPVRPPSTEQRWDLSAKFERFWASLSFRPTIPFTAAEQTFESMARRVKA